MFFLWFGLGMFMQWIHTYMIVISVCAAYCKGMQLRMGQDMQTIAENLEWPRLEYPASNLKLLGAHIPKYHERTISKCKENRREMIENTTPRMPPNTLVVKPYAKPHPQYHHTWLAKRITKLHWGLLMGLVCLYMKAEGLKKNEIIMVIFFVLQ